MYIEAVPNRGSPPAILLRESFRENGRVRKRTLANLSDWPTPLVEGDLATGQVRGLKAHEIAAPKFPGERLVVCKNPLLAEERARKREDLLHATEAALAKLAEQIARGTGRKG